MKRITTLLLAALALSCGHATTHKTRGHLSAPALEALEGEAFTVIYVHGLGEGGKESVPFSREMEAFIEAEGLKIATLTYQWDEARIDFLDIFDHWDRTRDLADASGARFYAEIIAPLEANDVKYYIVAYSLGARVVAGMLDHAPARLEGLQGLHLLGAALPFDAEIETARLPEGLRIQSYHSPGFDYALKTSFFIAEGRAAGGEVGFAQVEDIDNHRTTCTHAYKGGPLRRDYSSLAPAFIELFAHQQGLAREAEGLNLNVEAPVLEGHYHWHEITRRPHPDGQIVIQMNANTGWYRAVLIDGERDRTRSAWSYDLLSLLERD